MINLIIALMIQTQFVWQQHYVLKHHYQLQNQDRLSCEQKQWKCHNCSNNNYSKIVNNHQQNKINICLLCGISQLQSIVLKLRKSDTFAMIMDHGDADQEAKIDVGSHDDIDGAIDIIRIRWMDQILDK